MRENWIIRIVDKGYKFTRDVYIFRRANGGTEMLGSDGTMTHYKEGEVCDKPTLELDPEQLQALADELANVGYKPQKGYLEGKLEATERHLQDVRQIAKLTRHD